MLSRRRLMMTSSTSVKGSVNGIIQDDWKTIGKICAKGPEYVKKYYKVGDVKPIPIEGEGTINYEIIGIGVQDKADGTGKAAISWFPKVLLNSYHVWVDSSTSGGWAASSLRPYMNNDVFAKFPADLQAVITPVANPNDQGGTTTDKVWTVSKAECESGGIFYSKLGTNSQRVRNQKGYSDYWWTRSVYPSSYAWYVDPSGYFYSNNCFCDYGVAPGFAT